MAHSARRGKEMAEHKGADSVSLGEKRVGKKVERNQTEEKRQLYLGWNPDSTI